MSTSGLASAGSSPATPPASSPSEPRIEVRGVRSSWLTTDTKWSFMRSASLRRVTSMPSTMTPSTLAVGAAQGPVQDVEVDPAPARGLPVRRVVRRLAREGALQVRPHHGEALLAQDLAHEAAVDFLAAQAEQLRVGLVVDDRTAGPGPPARSPPA